MQEARGIVCDATKTVANNTLTTLSVQLEAKRVYVVVARFGGRQQASVGLRLTLAVSTNAAESPLPLDRL